MIKKCEPVFFLSLWCSFVVTKWLSILKEDSLCMNPYASLDELNHPLKLNTQVILSLRYFSSYSQLESLFLLKLIYLSPPRPQNRRHFILHQILVRTLPLSLSRLPVPKDITAILCFYWYFPPPQLLIHAWCSGVFQSTFAMLSLSSRSEKPYLKHSKAQSLLSPRLE